jgi:hypothetical protein
MDGQKIITHYDANEEGPNKWSAWDDFHPGSPVGTGPTKYAAIQDLYGQIYEEGH